MSARDVESPQGPPWWIEVFPEMAGQPVPERLALDHLFEEPPEWADLTFDDWEESGPADAAFDDGAGIPDEDPLGATIHTLRPERRRGDPRLAFEADATLHTGSSGDPARILDVSPGGCVVRASAAVRPGGEVTVIVPPNVVMSTEVTVTAEVRWIRLLDGGDRHAFEIGMRVLEPVGPWKALYGRVRWDRYQRRSA